MHDQLSTALFQTVRIGRRRFAFSTCESVSSAYRATIERLGLGASSTPSCEILDDAGNIVGRVSYNGKVWHGADWRAGDVPLFSPSFEAAR